MKRKFCCLLAGVMLSLATTVQAGPQEEYIEAYKIHLSAGASIAAYQNRMGDIARRYLAQDGWRIGHYVQPSGRSGARFVVATLDVEPGTPVYVLAFVGTENAKDIKIDLKTDKVDFTGPDNPAKVHQGFNDYVQAGTTAVLRNAGKPTLNLPDLLKSNPRSRLILTGHSLGGAAATLVGARLIEMGLNSEQIEVITFGAPAVGNAAFAEKFGPALNLTRIVIAGDPIVTALQGLVGGYRQFGKEVKFKLPETLDDPHNISGYLDVVMKNQYDKRRVALAAGGKSFGATVNKPNTLGKICIAPLQNKLPVSLAGEYVYMREAILDEYRRTLPEALLMDEKTAENSLQQAVAEGCRWLITPRVEGVMVRQERNKYYIANQQVVYEVQTRAIVDVADFSTGTYNFTPLEAFVHAFKGIASHQNNWLKP